MKNKEKEKKNSSQETIETIKDAMEYINFVDSFGIIVLKNGNAIQITNMFEYFRQAWISYKKAQALKDINLLMSVLNDTNGGVLTNDEVSIDINEISVMIASYIFKEKIEKMQGKEQREDIINIEELLNENGDSII